MKFKQDAAGGINLMIAACTVLVPGVLMWVLLGEFNVLGLDYLHAQGAPTGLCFADQSTNTPVACSSGTQVLLYEASRLDWRMAVACCALLPWAWAVCSLLCVAKLTNARVFPYATGTAMLVIGIAFSAAIPHANDALLIFARVVIALVAAAFGFLAANLLTNALLLFFKRGQQVYEQMAAEIKDGQAAKEQESKRRKQKGTGNDKDYVEDIKR